MAKRVYTVAAHTQVNIYAMEKTEVDTFHPPVMKLC